MGVFLSTLQTYIRGILAHVPGMHWAVIGAPACGLFRVDGFGDEYGGGVCRGVGGGNFEKSIL